MKKLLSICFLSILLGLLSFSTQAQSSCYGFWMENLQPDVLTGVANCGNPNGTYALNHTLGHAVLIGESNEYRANVVASDNVELYELHFCDCGEGKQVSLDWLLYKRNFETGEWELVNENLSAYADFSIYTLYPQINSTTGQCQSIKWLGGQVPNGFGVCEYDPTAVPSLYDSIMGIPACNTPTNYPGAMQSQAGTLPGSVVNVLGETTASIGMTPIYSQGFDYFYADFLASTRTIVAIKWRQAGDYKLVMNVRERIGGTPWTNCTWNKYGENNVLNETAYIGGHMACCGPVILSDTLHYPVLDTLTMEVCEGTTDTMGSPFTFVFGDPARSILDTTILIGELYNQNTNCQYIDIDTLRNVNYLVRMNPIAQIAKHKDTLCKCDELTTAMVRAMVEFDSTEIATFLTGDETVEYKLQWYHPCYDEDMIVELDQNGDTVYTKKWLNTYYYYDENGVLHEFGDGTVFFDSQARKYYYWGEPSMICEHGLYWYETINWRSRDWDQQTNDTTYMYIVRQVNTYSNYGETVVCEGPADTIYITFREITAPQVDESIELCMENVATVNTVEVNAVHDPNCATTTRWYTNITNPTVANPDQWSNRIDFTTLAFEGDNIVVNLNDYKPSVNKDTTVYFYAISYNAETGCYSLKYSVYTITFHQTPELTATAPDAILCPGSEAEMKVEITNNPFDVDTLFNYVWTGVNELNDESVNPVLTISDNGNATTYYLPTSTSYKHTLSQQIFTSDELSQGTISKIGFRFASQSDITRNPVAIYLSYTNKDEFANTSDWITTDLQLVYHGSVTFTSANQGWNDITLDTPFDYNPALGNLVVTFIDSSSDYSSRQFFRTDTEDGKYMSLRKSSDGSSYGFNQNGSRYSYRSDIRFTMPDRAERISAGHDNIVTSTDEIWNDYFPLYSYDSSYNQQVFTGEEVNHGKDGVITALSFDFIQKWYNQDLTGRNVKIYLGTTNQDTVKTYSYRPYPGLSFTITEAIPFSASSLTLVYDGPFDCLRNSWNTIELQTPYYFDGKSNLVVAVSSNATQDEEYDYFNSHYTDKYQSLYYSDNKYYPVKYRNNMKFTVSNYLTDSKTSTAYQPLTDKCDSTYTSTVYVVDDNNCKSNVVTFSYTTGDTLKPVLTKYDTTIYVNTCEAETIQELFPAYETVADFNNSGLAVVSDNCNINHVAISHNDVINPAGTGCEISLVRTYSFIDSCGNDTTFVQTIIGRDSVKPYFAIDRPMRLDPVIAPERNCTFNGPDTNTLLNMIAPYVVDNCSDSADLMSTIVFRWENTNLSPAGAENIFETQNHLTITAVITDKCGNVSDTTVVFFLDRPDTMSIGDPELLRNNICVSDYDSIYFDVATIVDDTISGPYDPYTLTWSEINNKPVTFSDVNSDSTRITFPEGGEYSIQMVVTNIAGCTAESKPITIYVRELPQLSIEPIVLNGQTEPYCPTYGNLTVEAVVANPVETDSTYWAGAHYTWTGESVNEYSTTNTTWITIVPEECTSSYTVHVHYTDNWNCAADAERTFQVAPHAMTFHGKLTDSVVTLSDTCTLAVPSFKEMIVDTNIVDDCYTFGKIKYSDPYGQVERIDTVTGLPTWYTQTPAAGTLFTGDSVVVTITITNPCGQTVTTTAIARKPANYPSVVLNQNFVERCYDAIVNPGNDPVIFALDEENSVNIDILHSEFAWTVDALPQDSIMSTTPVFALPTTLWNLKDTSDIYTITLDVVNQNGCPASATAQLKVHYQGDPIQVTIWPNTMCERNNGVLAVHYIPNDYQVELTGTNYGPVVKISDVPYHQTTPWNTIMFDSLHQGNYHIVVTDTFGCSVELDTVIGAAPDMQIDTPAIAVTNVTVCNDNNGAINITPENGYSFQLFFEQELVGTGTSYTGLHHGTYTVRKIKNSTLCYIDVDTTVAENYTPLTASVTFNPNTICIDTNNGYYSNGYIRLATIGLKYVVLNGDQTSTDTVFATDNLTAAYNINNLMPGSYYVYYESPVTGCHNSTKQSIVSNTTLPTFTVTRHPNLYCADQVNGSFTFDNSSYEYTVQYRYGTNVDTLKVDSLANGYYKITARNIVNNCRRIKYGTINDSLYYPYVNKITLDPNISCDPEVLAYNGSAQFDVVADMNSQRYANNVIDTNNYNKSTYYTLQMKLKANRIYPSNPTYYTYQYFEFPDTIEITQGNVTNTYYISDTHQYYSYSYTTRQTITRTWELDLISGIPATLTYKPYNASSSNYNAFTLTKSVRQYNATGGYDFVDAGNAVTPKTMSSAYNPSTRTFLPDDYSGQISQSAAFPYITGTTGYTLTLTDQESPEFTMTDHFTSGTAGFDTLYEGTYNYTITTPYKCSVNGQVTIGFTGDTMELVSTPNHMCEPTFEKPGDGTITVISPVAHGNHTYAYSFIRKNGMDVPYAQPMTETKYWLAADEYRVFYYDNYTGCKDSMDIMVYDSLYHFTAFEVTDQTSSNHCDTLTGNGTVTVAATSNNPDAAIQYSLDGLTWNTTGYFTGLANREYTVYAKDFNSACDTFMKFTISADTCKPTFFITDGTDTNSVFSYCIYNDDVTLKGWATTECDDNFKYSWYAPCSDIEYSDNQYILVDIDHVMPNGCPYHFIVEDTITNCVYDTIVQVQIHQRPNFKFTVNNGFITNNYSVNSPSPFYYCEQETLTIRTVAAPWNVDGVISYPTLVDTLWTAPSAHASNIVINGLTDYPNTNATICVQVMDNHGCWSENASLPISFNRVTHTVVYDTACDYIIIPGKGTYTYDEYGSNFDVVQIIPNQTMPYDHSCGEEITHHVTLYKSPVVDLDALVNPLVNNNKTYCEPYDGIVKSIYDTVMKYARPVDSITVTFEINRGQGYVAFNDPYTLTYSDYNSWIKMTVTNTYKPTCTPKVKEFKLDLQKAPVIDSFELATIYCNGVDTTLDVIISNFSSKQATVTLTLPNAQVLTEHVNARTDSAVVSFDFKPWNASFDEKNCTLRVVTDATIPCGSVDSVLKFNVDTTTRIHINDIEVCEGTVLTASSFNTLTGYTITGVHEITDQTPSYVNPSQPVDHTMSVTFDLSNDHCGNVVYTDTATVTVKPHLTAEFNTTATVLCLADAQAYLDTLVTLSDSNLIGTVTWKVGRYMRDSLDLYSNTSHPVDTIVVAEQYLVDSIFKAYKVDLFLTVTNNNGCEGVDTMIQQLRIVDVPGLTIDHDTMDLCVKTTVQDLIDMNIFHVDWNNHQFSTGTEIVNNYVKFAVMHEGVATQLDYNDAISSAAVDGDSLRVSVINSGCGDTVAYMVVNIFNADSLIQDTLQAACKGKAFSEFIVALPQFVGDEEILNDTVWFRGDFVDNVFVVNDTITVDSIINETAWVMCQITTTCLDTLTTEPKQLMVDTLPTVQIAQDSLHVCEGSTIDEIEFLVSDASIVTDTVWFLHTLADTLKSDYHFKRADNEAKIYVEIKTTCGSVFDSTVVVVDTLPIPKASGDVVICRTGDATMQVTNAAQTLLYAWIFDNDTVATGTSLTAHFAPNAQYPDSTDVTIDNETYTVLDNTFYEFTVIATDPITGCTSNTMVNTSNDPYASDVVTVKSTDAPQFVFKYQGNETHTINGLNVDGSLTDYTWEVSAPCTDKDRLVFVEYTIYHNGEVINNDSLSNYLLTQTTSSGVTTNMWVTRNIIGWENTQHDSLFTRQYFRSAVPGFETPQGTQTGNHFPNNDMAFGNNQQFDDLYMHFLNHNPVKKTIAPFVQGGEHKIVYRLIATSNEVPYQHLYFNTEDSVNKKIGGHIAYGGALTELAIDSIILNVAGDTTLVVNQTPAAPELAPSISTEENVIAPEMEVWPNPAPSIVTTFKARVHNMSGDATVTITNFTGKQVYSGNMFIDSDNFYFEADVNSLAVGAYIMTVRTKDAVVTKKLVVTVRQ